MKVEGLCTALLVMTCAGCGHTEADRRHDSAAYDAGVVAHAVAKKGEKAAEATGRALDKGANEAFKGWRDADRKEKEKPRERKD